MNYYFDRLQHGSINSVWMAGGGIKGGMTWGETDELGYKYVENDQAMHVHDLHATMLYLSGIDPYAAYVSQPGP